MKIAVTSQNRQTVTNHAGRCRKFWVYETEYADVVGKRLVELPEEQHFHDAFPPSLHGINVLITGGLAGSFRYYLKQQGVQAVATQESDPDRAVTAWLNGTLDEMPPFGSLGGCCTAAHA